MIPNPIEAALAQLEAWIAETTTELEKAKKAAEMLRSIGGTGGRPGRSNGQGAGSGEQVRQPEPEEKSSDTSGFGRHPAAVDPNTPRNGRKLSNRARVLGAIASIGRFAHRSEIEEALAKRGEDAKNLSSLLSMLGSEGQLVRFRLDHTYNSIHWGLPDWVGGNGVGEWQLAPGREPKGPIAQRLGLGAMDFSFGN